MPISVKQSGVLDGVVARIDDREDATAVWLRDVDGVTYKCDADPEVAHELVRCRLADPIRVTGQGDWTRGVDGDWILERFKITSVEVLDLTSPADIINAAKLVKGNGWNDIDSPIEEHLQLRK